MSTAEDSGIISFKDGMIIYASATHGSWTLPVSSVRVVGEYTNAEGPWLDDHFLVFVTGPENAWREASLYASGRDEFMKTLASVLQGFGSFGLANSATLKSRVLWPPRHVDKPLFTMSAISPPAGMSRSLARSLETIVELRISSDLA